MIIKVNLYLKRDMDVDLLSAFAGKGVGVKLKFSTGC